MVYIHISEGLAFRAYFGYIRKLHCAYSMHICTAVNVSTHAHMHNAATHNPVMAFKERSRQDKSYSIAATVPILNGANHILFA